MGGGRKRRSNEVNKTPPDSEDHSSTRNTRSSSKNKNIKFDELDFSTQRSTAKSPSKKKQKKADNSDQVIEQIVQSTQTSPSSTNNNAVASEITRILEANILNANPKNVNLLDLENGRQISELNSENLEVANRSIYVKKVPLDVEVEVSVREDDISGESSEDEEDLKQKRQQRVPGNQMRDREPASTSSCNEASNSFMQNFKQMEAMAKFFSQMNENTEMMNFMGQMANFSKAFSSAAGGGEEKKTVATQPAVENKAKKTGGTPKHKQCEEEELATPLGKQFNENVQVSPSDATLYVQAVKKRPRQQPTMLAQPRLSNQTLQKLNSPPKAPEKQTIDTEQIVANYLNKIRIADAETPEPAVRSVVRKVIDEGRKNKETPEDQGSKIVNRAIIEAEKFRATVEAPKGTVPPVSFDSATIDAQYCTVTSHVDNATKVKIGEGQYLEIIKLAPKTIAFQQADSRTDSRSVDILNKDGHTFLVQGNQKEDKIRNVRKWEQCFRVYASLYAEANPHRGAEIWKYVDTINNAANNFHWDNVAHYDQHFRQLMGQFPQRSWAHINVELWTKSMKDPFPSKKFGDNRNSQGNHSKSGTGGSSWKDNCCWKFNKAICTRNPCNFEHRCLYCGSYSHPSMNCFRKKGGSSSSSGSRQERRSRSPERKKKSKKHNDHDN